MDGGNGLSGLTFSKSSHSLFLSALINSGVIHGYKCGQTLVFRTALYSEAMRCCIIEEMTAAFDGNKMCLCMKWNVGLGGGKV